MANIELPKDAEGREIPLNTETLYTDRGHIFRVEKFEYMRSIGWYICGHYEAETVHFASMPSYLYLTPPDSWERLEDDLDRAVENDGAGDESSFHSMACAYMNHGGDMCGDCKFWNKYVRNCTNGMLEDVVSRIRKLRGEGE